MKLEEILRKIDFVRYKQSIKDPFPEETIGHIDECFHPFTLWGKIFKKNKHELRSEISIWEAYKKGYDKAYEEIKRELPSELEKE